MSFHMKQKTPSSPSRRCASSPGPYTCCWALPQRALAATGLLPCGFGGSGTNTQAETTKGGTCRGLRQSPICAAVLFLPAADFAETGTRPAPVAAPRSAQAPACGPHRVKRSHPSGGLREPRLVPRGRGVTRQPARKKGEVAEMRDRKQEASLRGAERWFWSSTPCPPLQCYLDDMKTLSVPLKSGGWLFSFPE